MNGSTTQPPTLLNSNQLWNSVTRFWAWWMGELSALLPPEWRRYLEGQGKPLLVICSPQQCTIKLGAEDQEPVVLSLESPPSGLALQQLEERRRKAARVILLLSPEQILAKKLNFPDATEADLANVLKFEMDKHTPFQADQVYYGHRILARDKAARRIQLELILVSKAALQPLLQQLAEWQLTPTLMSPALVGGQPQPLTGKLINLLPQKDGAQPQRRLLTRQLRIATILLLVGLALALPYYQRQQQIEQLEASLAGPRQQAQKTSAVKQQISSFQQARDFLVTKKAAAPSMLMLLKEVTMSLPDNTWLSRFEVRSGMIRLQGESDNASALIALLEQSPWFQDARFSSPVTVNPQSRKERFVIEAAITTPGGTS